MGSQSIELAENSENSQEIYPMISALLYCGRCCIKINGDKLYFYLQVTIFYQVLNVPEYTVIKLYTCVHIRYVPLEKNGSNDFLTLLSSAIQRCKANVIQQLLNNTNANS